MIEKVGYGEADVMRRNAKVHFFIGYLAGAPGWDGSIGSKADGVRISELIITAKAELEKMREQVQNVE